MPANSAKRMASASCAACAAFEIEAGFTSKTTPSSVPRTGGAPLSRAANEAVVAPRKVACMASPAPQNSRARSAFNVREIECGSLAAARATMVTSCSGVCPARNTSP
ncbi:MAG: hypothetical protein ABI488_06775 [Polyangiaceae bacterium]